MDLVSRAHPTNSVPSAEQLSAPSVAEQPQPIGNGNTVLLFLLDAIMYAAQACMENPSKRKAELIALAVRAAKLAMER